jgi:ABC-2 type transport system ATP-binding protein
MLKIEHLSKSFGTQQVLIDLNLNIRKGEIYALLGKNGSGKSTTIKILSRLLNADSGNILFNGHPLNLQTKFEIGFAPQEISVYNNLTFKENLQFFGNLYGLYGLQLKQRIQELFDIFDLHQHAHKKIDTLSGGWKRRINLAVAMIHNPGFLILDEPTAGLDIEIRNELWTLIGELKKRGISILLTTHLLDEAENLCNRIGILHNGLIQAEGTLEELKKLVPAEKIALIETMNNENLIERINQNGWQYRYYTNKIAVLLPRDYSLGEIINLIPDVSLISVTKRDVNLEHIYYEVLQKNSSHRISKNPIIEWSQANPPL